MTPPFPVADHLAAVSLWRAAKVREFQHRLEKLELVHDAAAASLLQRLHEVNEAVQLQQDQQAKQVSEVVCCKCGSDTFVSCSRDCTGLSRALVGGWRI